MTSLNPGTKIGSFEIVSLLGVGGMGDVYRATDAKLKRQVALKFLPDRFNSDTDRISRFHREAQVLAALNHPNVAQVYGFQESGGESCIVMELVEGQTLQQRLQRGPIPLDEALSIAIQICEALESAHEKGIVHRDLKPANIKLTADGKVKVLDFGLAKIFSDTTEAIDASNSPTMLSGASAGLIVGTAAYMSPEQSKGKAIDHRTDIWAFGCVLYEMLTGQQVFGGESVSESIAGILKSEPNWTLVPDSVPPTTRAVIRRCLEKDSRRRYQHIGDAKLDLTDVTLVSNMPAAEISPHRRLLGMRLLATISLILSIVLAMPAYWYFTGNGLPIRQTKRGARTSMCTRSHRPSVDGRFL